MGSRKPLNEHSDKPPLNGYHDFYDSDDYRTYLANKRRGNSFAKRVGLLSIDIFLLFVLAYWVDNLHDIKEMIFCVSGIVYFSVRAVSKVYKFIVNIGRTSDDFKKGVKTFFSLFNGD